MGFVFDDEASVAREVDRGLALFVAHPDSASGFLTHRLDIAVECVGCLATARGFRPVPRGCHCCVSWPLLGCLFVLVHCRSRLYRSIQDADRGALLRLSVGRVQTEPLEPCLPPNARGAQSLDDLTATESARDDKSWLPGIAARAKVPLGVSRATFYRGQRHSRAPAAPFHARPGALRGRTRAGPGHARVDALRRPFARGGRRDPARRRAILVLGAHDVSHPGRAATGARTAQSTRPSALHQTRARRHRAEPDMELGYHVPSGSETLDVLLPVRAARHLQPIRGRVDARRARKRRSGGKAHRTILPQTSHLASPPSQYDVTPRSPGGASPLTRNSRVGSSSRCTSLPEMTSTHVASEFTCVSSVFALCAILFALHVVDRTHSPALASAVGIVPTTVVRTLRTPCPDQSIATRHAQRIQRRSAWVCDLCISPRVRAHITLSEPQSDAALTEPYSSAAISRMLLPALSPSSAMPVRHPRRPPTLPLSLPSPWNRIRSCAPPGGRHFNAHVSLIATTSEVRFLRISFLPCLRHPFTSHPC